MDKVNIYYGDAQNKIFQLNKPESVDQQLLNLEKQILLHPRNAHNLLLPVTDELFVKGTYQSLVEQGVIKRDPTEMINAVLPHVNAEKAIIFVKGKFMVGPVALTVTGNSVKQADKFGNINTMFGSQDDPYYTKLRFPDINQFNMDNAISSNGGLISEILSQLLSISVDNVKNPVAELQNINMQTISVVSYLIERGLNEISIVNFINQPIIKEYLKAQKANESLFNKESGNELRKNELIEQLLKKLGYDNTTLPVIPDDWIFQNKGFKRNFDTNQLYVLTYFLELVDQARAYGVFNSTQNSDTKGLKDKQALDEAEARLNSLYPVDAIPLVPQDTVTRVNTNGVVAPFFKYGRESYKIFNPFYAIENSIFGEPLRNLKDSYAEYEKGANKDKVRQAVENDFQLFLIHNFVLPDDFDRLMKGDNSLPRRILDLKNKLPGNLVLQAFLPMINSTKDTKTGESISNLRLFEKELQALDEQAMSVSIQEIASNDPELYNDLVKFLMFQTGLNLSGFNYSKILPVGLESERFNTPDYMYVYQDMIQSGLVEMKERIKTPEQAQELFNKFKLLFDLNNARFLKSYSGTPHPVMKQILGYEMVKTRYFDSNLTNPDGSMKEYQLLGNSYQKRYNLSYIGVQNTIFSEAEELFDAVNNTPVIPIENTNYTFEYKGVSIGTEFKLGDQQEKALKELIEHVESGKQTAMTLSGSAGTGKTTIIGYLQKYFQEKKKRMSFIYMAPTHAATAELAFSTVKTGNNTLPATVQSSIYMNPALNLPEYTAKIKDRVLGFPVFVVDESSMLDIADINNLVTATERIGGKLIFLGDKMQIPKVTAENSKSKPLSPAFTNFEQVELTKVFRQKESGLLTLLDNIRSQSEFIPLKASNSSALEFTNNTKFKEELFDKIESDPENTKVISYTNASVKSMNNIIRKALGKPNNTEKGDVIIGYLGYGNKQIEKSNLANSISYTIQDYKPSGSTIQIVANSSKLESLIETGIKGIKPKTEFTYLQLDSNDSLQFKELNQTDFNNNNQYLSSIFEKIDSLNQQMKRKEIHYMTYVTEIRGITDPLAKLSVGDSYVYNPSTKKMEKYDSIKHKNIKTNGVGSLLFEKDVDYGYAITIHKSQGTTINNVFFLADSINSAQDTKVVDSTGNQITTEKNALYYVAMSRGRNRLVVDQGSLNYKTIETSVDMETPEVNSSINQSLIKTYKGLIKTLNDNQIFVFGSNPVGINGNPSKGTGGAALVATNNGWVRQNEKMDNRLSDSGKAWGLTTVAYPGQRRSKTPDEIRQGVQLLYDYAMSNPDKELLVAYTGTGTNLNGYSNQELANIFSSLPIPSNIIFEEQFNTLLDFNFLEEDINQSNLFPSVEFYKNYLKYNNLYDAEVSQVLVGEYEYYRELVRELLKFNPKAKITFGKDLRTAAINAIIKQDGGIEDLSSINSQITNTAKGAAIKSFDTAAVQSDASIKSVVHELVHLTIQKEYEKKGDFNKSVNELYTFARKSDDGSYGFSSPTEFLAEALSNPEFMNVLNQIPYKESNIFTKLMGLISNFLNELLNVKLNSNSVLAELINQVGQVIDNNVSEIKKNSDVQLDTLTTEIVNNFEQYFPQYSWMSESEKQTIARLVQSGDLTLTCRF